MKNEERIEEIEPTVMMLGVAYALSLVGMIFWLAT